MKRDTAVGKKGYNASVYRSAHGYLYTLPFLLGLVFIFSGLVYLSLKFSFFKMGLDANTVTYEWVGFSNYVRALAVYPTFLRTAFETFVSMFTSIPITVLFSLFVAVLLNGKMKGRTVFRAIFFIPVIVATGLVDKADASSAVMAAYSSLQASDATVAGGLFTFLDFQKYLSSMNVSTTMTAYVVAAVNNIMDVVKYSGVQILIFLSGLQSISPSIYESARIEGATGWESFWKITLPMITPVIFVNILFSIIDFLSRPGSSLMALIQETAYDRSDMGAAAAMSWVYFLLLAAVLGIVTLVFFRISRAADSAARRR